MYLFKGATFYTDGKLAFGDVVLSGDTVSLKASPTTLQSDCNTVDASEMLIIPGFLDVHVHLREPGFFYKESMATGTLAGASAGYTALCAMPNLNPVPDSLGKLAVEEEAILKDAKIRVYPYGALTVDEKGQKLSDMENIAKRVAAFSDDGTGLNDRSLMREAMLRAKALDKIIAAHCEDLQLRAGGYIHDGQYAKRHNHKGICSESEWKPIEQDLALAKETGCAYHVCHVSAKESVQLIRDAKRDGVRVTCETAPHYLTLCDENLREDGRFKMNPPLRSARDRDALLEAFADGTIDVLATDHAPHSYEEKSRGLAGSLMGVIGLETAFPVMYTKLVKTGAIKLERLIDAMCLAPRRIFRIADTAFKNENDFVADFKFAKRDNSLNSGAGTGRQISRQGAAENGNVCALEATKNSVGKNLSAALMSNGQEKPENGLTYETDQQSDEYRKEAVSAVGGFAANGGLYEGCSADIAVYNLGAEWRVDGKKCLSKGSSTPFEGERLTAKCEYTFLNGDLIWKNGQEN